MEVVAVCDCDCVSDTDEESVGWKITRLEDEHVWILEEINRFQHISKEDTGVFPATMTVQLPKQLR